HNGGQDDRLSKPEGEEDFSTGQARKNADGAGLDEFSGRGHQSGYGSARHRRELLLSWVSSWQTSWSPGAGYDHGGAARGREIHPEGGAEIIVGQRQAEACQ